MNRKTDRRTVLGGIAAAGLASLLPATARAQGAFPDRPITLVVPWGAGGGTDAVARIVAASLMRRTSASRSTWSTARAARAWSAIRPSPPRRPTATRSA
jgi:hypothetical protein